jgi:hypothetical protein
VFGGILGVFAAATGLLPGLKRPHCPIHCTFIVRKYSHSESGKPHTVPTVSRRFAGLN